MTNDIGYQRDWVWRGWQIRYCFKRIAPEYQDSDLPLILLHGFGASIPHWRKNIPVLSERHTVYALDLLGFGSSRKAFTQYEVKLWAEQVYDFWQTFIGQPIVLVGNSIGSLVALYLAANYPEIAKGLVMLALPDVGDRQAAIPKALQPLVKTIENLLASPLLIKAIFYAVCRPGMIRRGLKCAYVQPEAVTDELVEIICTPTRDGAAARALVALTQSNQRPQFSPPVKLLLRQLNLPVLLIWGKGDRLIPPRLAGELAQQNTRIDLELWDNVGHCPHDECPEQFNQVLLAWLENKFSSHLR
jgi:haloalkane dehalogenase